MAILLNETPLAHSFIGSFTSLQEYAHAEAVKRGFHETERGEPEAIALMHSELSEALEGSRHGNPPSDKIPEFSQVEEELADVIIRIMDHAGAKKYRISEAIITKIQYNESRPYKHGKKF